MKFTHQQLSNGVSYMDMQLIFFLICEKGPFASGGRGLITKQEQTKANKTYQNTQITVSCHFIQMSTSSIGHAIGLCLVYFNSSCLFCMLKDDVER